jgi:hypothetical protein
LEAGDEASNERYLARRKPGGRDLCRVGRRADERARKGHGSPALLRDRFFKIDQLHLPLVIDNHRPIDSDIHDALERDKHHPVGLA